MSRIQFLEAICQKAGLPKDSWEKPGFKLWKFSAQIFSEE
jgi:AMMECR1 domain-containing protein